MSNPREKKPRKKQQIFADSSTVIYEPPLVQIRVPSHLKFLLFRCAHAIVKKDIERNGEISEEHKRALIQIQENLEFLSKFQKPPMPPNMTQNMQQNIQSCSSSLQQNIQQNMTQDSNSSNPLLRQQLNLPITPIQSNHLVIVNQGSSANTTAQQQNNLNNSNKND